MLTVHLPTVNFPVLATRCQYKLGEVGIQPMNKFEQLSSDDHQMSVAGGGVGYLPSDPSHDPCDIYLSPYEQIDACENITFPQLPLLALINVIAYIYIYI